MEGGEISRKRLGSSSLFLSNGLDPREDEREELIGKIRQLTRPGA
jgi:hypothetical protein